MSSAHLKRKQPVRSDQTMTYLQVPEHLRVNLSQCGTGQTCYDKKTDDLTTEMKQAELTSDDSTTQSLKYLNQETVYSAQYFS
jgi:hypothetical protein